MPSLLFRLVLYAALTKIDGFNSFNSGWNPKTSLWDLLDSTLTYQHRTYAEAIKTTLAKPMTS